jgi:hypothetical protein
VKFLVKMMRVEQDGSQVTHEEIIDASSHARAIRIASVDAEDHVHGNQTLAIWATPESEMEEEEQVTMDIDSAVKRRADAAAQQKEEDSGKAD